MDWKNGGRDILWRCLLPQLVFKHFVALPTRQHFPLLLFFNTPDRYQIYVRMCLLLKQQGAHTRDDWSVSHEWLRIRLMDDSFTKCNGFEGRIKSGCAAVLETQTCLCEQSRTIYNDIQLKRRFEFIESEVKS